MTERYYDLKKFPIHKEYWDDEKYLYKPTFNRYISIRLATGFDELCNLDNSGLLNKETKIITYISVPWGKLKPKTQTYNCKKLFIEDTNPDMILIPNDYCNMYANSTINCGTHCEKIFLSETKIQEYENQYQQMYANIINRYSQHIEQLKKYKENIYRLIVVVDTDNNICLNPESGLDEKIEYMFERMVSNDYISIEVEIDSVIKSTNWEEGVDFIGKVNGYNRKFKNVMLNMDINLNDNIVLSSDVFVKLQKGSPDDINIYYSSIDFVDTTFTMILIRESIYKKRFLAWIYDYIN